MRQFTRKEIWERLEAKRRAKQPIIMGGAGIGLVAKVADRAGIDAIFVYNTGPFRMDGHGSLAGYLAYGDSNAMTLELGKRILQVVENTPVVGGIGAADPYRNIEHLLKQMLDMGFSAITNVPTTCLYDGIFRKHIDATGLGYPEEIKLVELCQKYDVFTSVYATTPDEARAMARAGADILSPHVHLTAGGMIGAHDVPDLQLACDKVEEMAQAAREVNPNIIVLAHGGPFEDPASVQEAFNKTSVDGYLGASSVERLPVERAITQIVNEFKVLKLTNK
ncbi:MAG: phosphoenolpyruvate hydrolase family protein [Anaerolineae bacterium]|nr:phosphoenolpyruvate hydrolase family protein [Anaerolineae bacterium]